MAHGSAHSPLAGVCASQHSGRETHTGWLQHQLSGAPPVTRPGIRLGWKCLHYRREMHSMVRPSLPSCEHLQGAGEDVTPRSPQGQGCPLAGARAPLRSFLSTSSRNYRFICNNSQVGGKALSKALVSQERHLPWQAPSSLASWDVLKRLRVSHPQITLGD